MQAFKGIKSLIVSALFNTANNKGQNPLWEGIKYNGPDPERRISPLPAREKAEAVLQRAILDLTNPPCRCVRQPAGAFPVSEQSQCLVAAHQWLLTRKSCTCMD